MRLLSRNEGATHEYVNDNYQARYAVEQRQAAIGGPEISGRFSYCSVTANWKARSDTSGSRSTTRWRSRSRLRCSPARLVATAETDGR